MATSKKKVSMDKKVPAFRAEITGDKSVRLSDYKGKKLVIYFYPKDSTSGCTTEGEDFRDSYSKFKRANTEILGVSRDSIKSHDKFKEKYKFPFELLSDPEEEVCSLFDVIHEKNMYGKKFKGVVRSTFVIDEEGRLIQEWRKVKVKGHVQEVLDFVKGK